MPSASVDWCEPNFVVSSFVAEWWNTLSSLPIALAGLLGLVWLARRRPRPEPRFFWGFGAIALIGVGSAAFHGTLSAYGQGLDELPMVYGSLCFVYIVRWRGVRVTAEMKGWRRALIGYGLLFTALYFGSAQIFSVFILTYAALVAYVVWRSWCVSFRLAPSPVRRRLFWWSAGAYVGGVLLLWLPEHVLLPCDHPLQSLQLHAWFHLTSAIGSSTWLLWALHDHRHTSGVAIRAGGT